MLTVPVKVAGVSLDGTMEAATQFLESTDGVDVIFSSENDKEMLGGFSALAYVPEKKQFVYIQKHGAEYFPSVIDPASACNLASANCTDGEAFKRVFVDACGFKLDTEVKTNLMPADKAKLDVLVETYGWHEVIRLVDEGAAARHDKDVAEQRRREAAAAQSQEQKKSGWFK